MLVLGIDPGFALCGYALVEKNKQKFKVIKYGTINTEKNLSILERFIRIHNEIYNITKKYKPDIAAIEKLFFSQNTKTAINVAEARGVIIVALAKSKIKLIEYTPLQVKQAVVGYGKATKNQVKYMVKRILNLKEEKILDDTTDALAIAICHLNSCRF